MSVKICTIFLRVNGTCVQRDSFPEKQRCASSARARARAKAHLSLMVIYDESRALCSPIIFDIFRGVQRFGEFSDNRAAFFDGNLAVDSTCR